MVRSFTTTELLRFVEAAIQAPSSHNTQPWLFGLRDGAIDVYADRTRALPVNDPDDRELTISCGAALFNLRVATAAAEQAGVVHLIADEEENDRLASLEPIDGAVDEGVAGLLPQISARRTYRRPFAKEVVADDDTDAIALAAQREGASLHVFDDVRRRDVASLIAEGDRIQFADRRWRRELAAWMHPRRRGDGLTVPLVALPVTRLVVSSLNLGGSTADKDRDLAEDAPVLAVLTTSGDSVRDWLVAGQALQRMLLTAASVGLQAGYLNQPCQVAELRPRLQALLDIDAFPQLVLRLGRPGGPSEPSPRRPVADVVI